MNIENVFGLIDQKLEKEMDQSLKKKIKQKAK